MLENQTERRPKNMMSDPYYFAAYLNMARHNTFLVMTNLCSKLGKEPIKNDDDIFTNKVFGELTNPGKDDIKQKIIKYLNHSFPFLQPIENEWLYQINKKVADEKPSPNDYYNFFRELFETLKLLRNTFTHGGDISQVTVSPEIIAYMKKIYDAAINKARERMKYEETDVEHLRRMRPSYVKGKKQMVENAHFHYKFDDATGKITMQGLAFFTCLFLEAKYAYQFLGQLYGFKDTRMPKSRAILEVYREYHMRIPNQRLDSHTDKNQLFMDMLNELSRCPSELFDQLERQYQERFKVTTDLDQSEEASEDVEVPDNTLKRHEDRFTYFAMRYLDDQKLLKRLRFMLDLGNYHFHVYPKEIDGDLRTRRLTKKITAFGRLNEFSIEQTKAAYGNLVRNAAETDENYDKPWIVETTPHYHFFEDNVPVKLTAYDDEPAAYPNIEPGLNAKSGAFDKSGLIPDFYISRDELMPLVFYTILTQSDNKNAKTKAEILVEQYLKQIKKCFEDIQNGNLTPVSDIPLRNKRSTLQSEKPDPVWIQSWNQRLNDLRDRLIAYQLEPKHLPDDLRHYLMGIESAAIDAIASAQLQRLLHTNKRKLELLQKAQNKDDRNNRPGKKGYLPLKAGNLAGFIAEDLMRFQPVETPEGKGKPTGLTYQILQAKIAFFGLEKDNLQAFFRSCQLIDSPNPHPFLSNVSTDHCNGIVNFYKKYLEARKTYLEECAKAAKYEDYHWLDLNKARARQASDYARQLAAKYLQLPVNLPRGLFIQPIRKALSDLNNPDLTQALSNTERANIVFMLTQYYRHHLDDDTQPFYLWPRTYKVIDQYEQRGLKPTAQRKPVGLTTQQLLKKLPQAKAWAVSLPETEIGGGKPRASKLAALKKLDQTEKIIRNYQAKDKVMLLMIKDLIKTSGDKDVLQENIRQLRLADIDPQKEPSALSMQIPYVFLQTCAEHNEKGEKTGRTVVKHITEEKIKLKNYGDFRRFLKDRRLANLMFYFPDERIERALIQNELMRYDAVRIDIFRIILGFEKAMLTRFPDIRSDRESYTSHNAILARFFSQLPEAEKLGPNMLALRNAFSHNQYPEHGLFARWCDKNEAKTIADKLLMFAQKTYGQFTQHLQHQ